jgi:hypothetical protein
MKPNKIYKLKRDLYEGQNYFGRLMKKGELVFLIDIQIEEKHHFPHFLAKVLTKNGIEYIKDLLSGFDGDFEEFIVC